MFGRLGNRRRLADQELKANEARADRCLALKDMQCFFM